MDDDVRRGEEALVARLGELLGDGSKALVGDDAALLHLDGRWAVTVDSQTEGVHLPAGLDPAIIGRRLVAVNASDLAAVGADPAFGFLTLAFPKGWDHERCLAAVGDAATTLGVVIGGGDISTSPVVSASLTLLGRLPSDRNWVSRSRACPGDRLWLTGGLGRSALGRHVLAFDPRWAGPSDPDEYTGPIGRALTPAARRAVSRHLRPMARLAAGRWLSTRPRAAAIDVSDGFAKDLHRLLAASRVL